jgi:murein DD-endopeptidase MepM/ murein hydrolase activator NlpD
VSSGNVDNPTFHDMEEQQTRIAGLGEVQPALLSDVKEQVDLEIARLERALQSTGINPKSIQARVNRDQGSEGGPLLPLGPAQIATQDQAFNVGVTDTMTSLNELANVVTALNAVPLIQPVAGELSSSFGARNDPFTEELAFHSGVDLRGEKGSDVHATAAGIVVFAGPRGAYGNTVEVDHGYGIRTRYAHLSKIAVAAGAKLDKGSVVGKLGSTGRSTGPHVHYEVWYDDAVRDPEKFIKAGRNVRQE